MPDTTIIPDAELSDILRLASDIIRDVSNLHRKRRGLGRIELQCELTLIRKTAAMLLEVAAISEQSAAATTMAGA